MSDDRDYDSIVQRLETMERLMRNMRFAIIIIAAFFVYQAIAPSGLWKGIEVRNVVKLKELILIDDSGNELARLGASHHGGSLVLDHESGARLKLSADMIRLLKATAEGHTEQLRIDHNGMSSANQ